ncbi:EamA family transporter [Streptomyces lydicus]|uniref:EamA family transporter n=1 Tax=Streptomyces lydicus TaxID=47763 RepID=UPI00379C1238
MRGGTARAPGFDEPIRAAGLWPLAVSRAASVLAILPVIARRPARMRMPWALAWECVGAGALGTAAITLYTLALREQLLSLAVVLTALYPAIPVVLGVTVLHERLTRAQAIGLLCAAAAIALISLGQPKGEHRQARASESRHPCVHVHVSDRR